MHGEEKRREVRAELQRREIPLHASGGRAAEEAPCDEIEDSGVRGVQQNVREMVAGRIHSPEEIIETQRHPGNGNVVAEEEGRPHPSQVSPAQSSEVRIRGEIHQVIPVHEFILQGRREDEDGRDRHTRRDPDAEAPFGTGRGRPAGSRPWWRERQMWIAWPSAASVASRAASDKVGWAWIVRMISSSVASSVRPSANSWMISVASGPTMWTPRSSPVALS